MIPEQSEENVPTGSCPPSSPPAAPQPSNHPSARLPGRNNNVVTGRGPLVVMALLCLVWPQPPCFVLAVDNSHVNSRPCSFNSRAMHKCATQHLAPPSSSTSGSSSSSSVSSSAPSSGAYVGNAHYRLTSNELANRKYMQLQLANQQLIQRLHPQLSPSSSSSSSSSLSNPMTSNATANAINQQTTSNADFGAAFNETLHMNGNKRLIEDIYGIRGEELIALNKNDFSIPLTWLPATLRATHAGLNKKDKEENVHQMNIWLSEEASLQADDSSPVEFRARPPPNAGSFSIYRPLTFART